MNRLRIARVFEESGGFHFSCNSLDYLDARGKAYKTKADALRAAFRCGYTHATGSGCYRKGVNVISCQVKLDEHDWREHKTWRNQGGAK